MFLAVRGGVECNSAETGWSWWCLASSGSAPAGEDPDAARCRAMRAEARAEAAPVYSVYNALPLHRMDGGLPVMEHGPGGGVQVPVPRPLSGDGHYGHPKCRWHDASPQA